VHSGYYFYRSAACFISAHLLFFYCVYAVNHSASTLALWQAAIWPSLTSLQREQTGRFPTMIAC